MAQHHGLNKLSGMHAFCHHDHPDHHQRRSHPHDRGGSELGTTALCGHKPSSLTRPLLCCYGSILWDHDPAR